MKEAFQRQPHNFSYHYRIGLRSLQSERYEDAVGHLQQAILFNPHYADVYNYLGVAYAESDSRADAIRELQRALDRNPEYMVARHRDGVPEDQILQQDLYR